MSNQFAHPIFCDAIDDLGTQGLIINTQPANGAIPYALIGGRYNARWWLVPLQNGRVTGSGLALFQPLLLGPRVMKAVAVSLSLLGLSRFWARQRVYVVGEPELARFFPQVEKRTYAYFTGTESPHRKVAVQIMDATGRLLGFAKITRNPAVAALLIHEAAILQRLEGVEFRKAYVPKVLFAGPHKDSMLLVTDTLKTTFTPSVTRFGDAHRLFLQELWSVSDAGTRSAAEVASEFGARFEQVRGLLDESWRNRISTVLASINLQAGLALPVGLSHGDFTPWNTFPVGGRLYVFDWEYAEYAAPRSNDLVHFVMNQSNIRNLPIAQKLANATVTLNKPWAGIAPQAVAPLLIVYVLTQVLRQVERLPREAAASKQDWDGAAEQAAMLDALVAASAGA